MEEDEFRLPVVVVDEAWDGVSGGQTKQRADLLRNVLRGASIAGLFLGTNINVVTIARYQCSHMRTGAGSDYPHPWAQFIALLPRLYLTAEEEQCLAAVTQGHSSSSVAPPAAASPVLRLLDSLYRLAKSATDSAHCVNPGLFHRRCGLYLDWEAEHKPSLDALLAATAQWTYSEKRELRSVDGVRAQVLYLLGHAVAPHDAMCVHAHCARYTRDYSVEYHDEVCHFDNEVGKMESWDPAPAFPSLRDDPLLPLVLGGCCEGSIHRHPAPFQIRSSRDSALRVTLTSAAAVMLARDRGIALRKKAAAAASNYCGIPLSPSELPDDAPLLESIATTAVICASRGGGLGGIPVRDFLLRLAAELQTEVPVDGLRWCDPEPLYTGSDSNIPPFLCMGEERYPTDILGGIGQLRRSAGDGKILCVGYNSGGEEIVAVAVKDHEEQALEGAGAGAVTGMNEFEHCQAALLVVVTPGTDIAGGATRDGKVVRLVVDSLSGEVRLEPVGGTTNTRQLRRRRLCVVVACDVAQVTKALRKGLLRSLCIQIDQDVPSI